MPHHRFLPALLLLLPAGTALAQQTGEQIYNTQCARCHGPKGEGTKKYPQRLEGDRSPRQLSVLIAKTMPENAPGSLTPRQALDVAVYLHDAFYSPVARERLRPARIQLARLTVRQYRNAVADLIGSFRSQPVLNADHGLKAEYFKGRRFRNEDRVLERTDSQVAFDFATDSPVPGKIEPHEFSLRWNGALLAQQTGEYTFVVRTEHAARLWLNDLRQPLIDAWVKSGSDTEYRASLFLVAGQVYPLRLEYTKAKQGVDDSGKNKNKPKPVKSSVSLLWQPPQRALEPIPARHLAPITAPERYVCATAFPPDDRSYGWERGTTVSKEWAQASTDAALAVAGYVASRIEELAAVKDSAPDRQAKLLDFCRRFAERAFRRPLTADQQKMIDRQFAAGKDAETAIKRVVLFVLESPAFLYREIGGQPDGYEVAARLSFALWDSIPDRELLAAAAARQLTTPEQLARQAERLLADFRGRTKLREFLLTWLKADQPIDLAKVAGKFPSFDAAALADLRTSLELFLDDVAWSDRADFRRFLLSDEVYLNGRLAKFYGTDLPSSQTEFRKVYLDPGQRAGVLSHPYLMTSFAESGESSPIHRGVFLARGVLGLSLRPPPEAVAPLAPDLHPGLTTRERVTLQTRPTVCMTCHGVINPLGFTLEHFDALGRFRAREKDKPIDALGTYQTRDGKTVKVNGARELGTFLAGSPETQAAFVEQLFHHLIQQPVRAYGPDAQTGLQRSFTDSGFHIRKLAISITALAARAARANR